MKKNDVTSTINGINAGGDTTISAGGFSITKEDGKTKISKDDNIILWIAIIGILVLCCFICACGAFFLMSSANSPKAVHPV